MPWPWRRLVSAIPFAACSSDPPHGGACAAVGGTYALDLSTAWPLPMAQELAEDGTGCNGTPGPSTCQPATRHIVATVQVGQGVGGAFSEYDGTVLLDDGGSCTALLTGSGFDVLDDAGHSAVDAFCDVSVTRCTGTPIEQLGLRIHASGPSAGSTAVNLTIGPCCWAGAIVPGQDGGLGGD